MGQTITVILIDPSTLDFHPLIDTTNIISLLTKEQKERFMEKHKTNENSSFTFSIQEIAYEVEITKTPSGDLFAVLKSLQEKSLKSLLELESTMREQQMKLFELAQSRTITKESLRETFEHACQTIAELIQVERERCTPNTSRPWGYTVHVRRPHYDEYGYRRGVMLRDIVEKALVRVRSNFSGHTC
ncbi:hypothetical protein ACF3OH_09975 [Chryseomicrobium aureum]|uniref:hypothetical protein n=1 Tax=Chryseomicrobium aureum TaxID=1441723 RepID=UPI00370DD672